MIAGEHRLALPAGYQLGRYRFQEILGAGGFGITYLAEDTSLHRQVAIKELLPNDIATRVDGSTVVAKTKSEEANLAWARDRFIKEGQALAACEHNNVVHVYEMVEANGTAYMVTKFEAGRSFSAWLKEVEGPPTEKELRAILLPLLSGLEKVHRAGFLHRDLKPENIYLTDDGRPILLDFGSARQAVTDRTTSLTSIVTSGYAPFEQYHEDGKQGAWTDIYAMAAVMYRAIHGKKPPEATRRLKDDPCLRLAKAYAGKYSAPFLQAIDKGLAVDAKNRPQSVAEWKTMLGVAPAENSEPVFPWWTPWLVRARHLPAQAQQLAQRGISLAKARPEWAAGAAVGILILSLIVSKLTGPSPVPHPVAVTPAPATPTPVPSTPAPTPATPHPSAFKNNPGPTTPVPDPPDSTSGPAVSGPPVERKLVAIWETKAVASGKAATIRWEQYADGHYVTTMNGAPFDAGTITAAGGRMHQKSQTTGLETDAAYQLKSTYTLATSGPLGTATWKRVRALPMPSNDDASSGDDNDPDTDGGGNGRTNGGGDAKPKPKPKPDSIRREIQRRVPFRLPF